MAIESRDQYRHRCTDCGARWYPVRPPTWVKCSSTDHPCPKCSAKPEPPKVECAFRHDYLPGTWNYCPRCGVALPAKQEG